MTSAASTMLADVLAGRVTEEAIESALLSEADSHEPKEFGELAAILESYLNSLGVGLAALSTMAKDPQFGRGVGFAAGSALLYVVDEDDFLPESEVGPLGLLDDTYLVHGCIAALRTAFPELPAPEAYEPPDETSVVAVRSLLPAGVADALDRTCDNLARAAALFAVGGGVGGTGGDPALRPPLRVREAAEAIGEPRRVSPR